MMYALQNWTRPLVEDIMLLSFKSFQIIKSFLDSLIKIYSNKKSLFSKLLEVCESSVAS